MERGAGFPRNSNQGVLNSTNVEDSYCDDFFNYPKRSTPSTVLRPGNGPDGKFNDWWKYLSNPNAAL